jgi:hypothetical protein
MSDTEAMSNTAKLTKPRSYVHIKALWGNDDAESSIKLSRKRWAAILAGCAYDTRAWGWYEGRRSAVSWSFMNGCVSIDGADGEGCISELPVRELVVELM